MDSQSHEKVITTDAIPNVEIMDPNNYVTSNKIIAHIIIKSPQGEHKRPLVRTKKGGYMMQ